VLSRAVHCRGHTRKGTTCQTTRLGNKQVATVRELDAATKAHRMFQLQLQLQYLARQTRATHKGARGSWGTRNKTSFIL
jgi:hypothetical protein